MNKKHLYIEVGSYPSSSVTEASKEAVDLANELGMNIHIKWHGVREVVRPGMEVINLAEKLLINKEYSKNSLEKV